MSDRIPLVNIESQQIEQDAIIELLQLDLSRWGGGYLYFTPNDNGSKGVKFDGIEYSRVPMELSQVEFSNQGSLPTPELKLPALDYALMAQLASADDLVGAPLTRIRTYAKCLDGEPDGGRAESWAPEKWVISQMTEQTDTWVTFTLRASFDQQNAMAPSEMALRSCIQRYRYWDSKAGAFNYDHATCPYRGEAMFDAAGKTTSDPSKDVCSLQYTSGCKARYGNGVKPFLGSPSLRSSS